MARRKSHGEAKDEEDLELSDVSMQDNNQENEEYNSEEEDNKVKEPYEKNAEIIAEEEAFIMNKIFAHVLNKKQISLEEEEVQEEPEEELDEEERLRLLVDHLNPEQMARYEYFRRTTVNRAGVRKIANTVLNQSVSNNVAIVLSGVSKLFLGEIIEKARDVKKRYDKSIYLIKLKEKKDLNRELRLQNKLLAKTVNLNELNSIKQRISHLQNEINKINLFKLDNEGTPLLPEHIREAWRLYRIENGTISSGQWRTQGERNGLMFR